MCAHCDKKKTPKLEPVPGDLFVSATCSFKIALAGIKYCSAHSKKRQKRRVYKNKNKKKSILQQTYSDRRQCQHLTNTRLHLFTHRRQDFSCQLSESAMYFSGTKKHQEQQPSHFNVSTYINAVYFLFFFCLNWAAKVHEPLANLAAHECRVSYGSS